MIIDHSMAQAVIKGRPRDSHKGDYGRLLLIGGHYPYGGAIIMAALAAVNSGAGLVTVATDQANIPALHSQLPEAMAFAMTDKELLLAKLRQADVVLLGPGLGEDDLAQEIFQLVLSRMAPSQCLILDGSALGLLARAASPQLPACQLILTPHQKEWQVLSGLALDQQTRVANQEALTEGFPVGTILVAKRHHSQLYQAASQRWGQIALGGPYQATGGMGDTLAGMIAGFVGQFKDSAVFDVVASALYLHSAIAEDLSQDHYVVLPSMISNQLSRTMKTISRENKKPSK